MQHNYPTSILTFPNLRLFMSLSFCTQYPTGKYHLLAILTVGVWGTTFISTKVLIENGLSPHEIFFSPLPHRLPGYLEYFSTQAAGQQLERRTAFSCYRIDRRGPLFLTENTALSLTQTTNVAFIICMTPLLTTALSLLTDRKEKASKQLMAGSVIALLGVALLIFNGSFVLKLSPLGDFLTLCAGLSWAIYSLIIRKLSGRYPAVFITRKVFFYGILTGLPTFLVHPFQFPLSGFANPVIWANLLFLAVLASLICFVAWNIVLKQLGTIQSSNYLYLNPLFTTIAASLILEEQLTVFAVAGVGLVLGGVYFAARKS